MECGGGLCEFRDFEDATDDPHAVFTGIVTGIGKVAHTSANRLGVEAATIAAAVRIGDSVAVNGACLTVTEVEAAVFFADVVPETLNRTNLGRLVRGDLVNLEPSLTLEHSIDGHLVQGHVDATATIRRVTAVASGSKIEIELPESLGPYVAEKGSVAVDGTSLTVVGVGVRSFTIALIPHTLAATIAHTYRKGTAVNLEADVIARYVHRVLTYSKPSE